jgi:hypothetical protein
VIEVRRPDGKGKAMRYTVDAMSWSDMFLSNSGRTETLRRER